MTKTFAQRYPKTNRFVTEHGWIEIGYCDYDNSFVRAYDEGGTIWESEGVYDSVDAALEALELELSQRWLETYGESDESDA
jgi:hypothetical protein